ncbi:MAG: DUF3592 domain-containing protein [Chloroflexi bacterium]|nr:MAG: DUF3592 domain-containing protein [Chloroflexota bacterium]
MEAKKKGPVVRKKYTIVVEDNQVVSIEIDGKKYESWIEIEDNIDQQKVERMVDAATDIFIDEDFATRTTSSLGKIVVSVFGVVSLILLTIAVIAGINTGRAVTREESAPGRVTGNRVLHDSEGDTLYYPVVAFSLPNGSIKTVELSTGSWPAMYEAGEEVTVLYDPANPDQVRIQSLTSTIGMWLVAIITGTLGLIFLGATGFAWWMLRRRRRKKRPGQAASRSDGLGESTGDAAAGGREMPGCSMGRSGC